MAELKKQLDNLMLAYRIYRTRKYTIIPGPKVKRGEVGYEAPKAERGTTQTRQSKV